MAALIILVSGAIMGYTGFGFNLFGVPLIALLLDVRTAIGVGITASVATAILILLQDASQARWDRLRFLVPFSIVGMVVGAQLSAQAGDDLLRYVVSV